jgi:hypothetical protein
VFILADGSVHTCYLINMSSSGAAISAELQPPVGTPLAIGGCVGRVVRIFETGFAVKFVQQQSLDDLSRLIVVQPRRASISPAEGQAGVAVSQSAARCA